MNLLRNCCVLAAAATAPFVAAAGRGKLTKSTKPVKSGKSKSSEGSTKSGKSKPSKGQCLDHGQGRNQGLENVIDCVDDASESLNNIANHLSNGGGSFSGYVTGEGEGDYDTLRRQYASAIFDTMPSYIVQATNDLDVRAAVVFGAECGYQVTARSGGHSFLGLSSCDSDDAPCIQLDVGMIEHINVSEVDGKKQLHVGPGVSLEDLAEVLAEENIFVSAGECNEIGLGGHAQTGGFGPWGPLFGALSHYVLAFKIVLSDGSLHTVTKPETRETSNFNDDLFYAVLGGASGSYGIIVELLLKTVKEDEYHSFYWEVNFLYDSVTTLPGIINMLRKYADLLKDVDVQSTDTRWNIWWTLVGSNTSLMVATGGAVGFNYFQMDVAWAIPKSEVPSESDALKKAQAFYDALASECTGCILLDDVPLPDTLKAMFPSAYGVSAPISVLYKDLTIFVWDSFQLDDFPYKSSSQQGPDFPDADALEEILTGIDSVMPKTGTEPYFMISQFVTWPSQRFADSTIALPFQDDAFGVTFDAWDFTNGAVVEPFQKVQEAIREVQDSVISALGGVDHRMFWSAYEDPCLECGDWEKYYESDQKYVELVRIKRCVDPDDMFQNRMSVPTQTRIG